MESAPHDPDPSTLADARRQARSRGLLLLAVGLLIAVAYAEVLLSHSRGRWIAPLRDDLIFFQYAHALDQGHPYRFYRTAECTSGATSHLYVLLLAALRADRSQRDVLVAAAFRLNAAFWLVTLLLAYATARRLFGDQAFAAALLVALTAPVSFGFFALHDMGLATMLFFLAFFGLAKDRASLAAVALFLLSWARPEGLLVALALIATALAAPRGARKPAWALAGVAGLAGTATVLAFNYRLTGQLAFTSMSGKGLVGHYPFHAILTELGQTLGATLREVFVESTDSARGLYFFPLIAIPALLGFVPRCRGGTVELWLALSAGLILVLVSASGFAGLQHDKYLVWILALTALYAVAGLPAAADALGGRIRWGVLYAFCAGYALIGTVYFLGDYGRRVAEESAVVGAVRNGADQIPAGARVGVLSGSGVQYYLPEGDEVINLNGVTQPAFGAAWGDLARQVEILRSRPELRPRVWLLSDAERGGLAPTGLVGRVLFSAPAFLGAQAHVSFYEAACDVLDAGRTPVTTAALEALKGRVLVDELPLCSPAQEAAHAYFRFNRPAGVRLLGEAALLSRAGKTLLETGYAVFGFEEFDVAAQPGKDLWVVLRTSLRARVTSLLSPHQREQVDVTLTPPIDVTVLVDGQQVPLEPGALTPAAGDFDECVFRIPARFVQTPRLRIRLAGDHVAYHYWFYQ